MTGADIAALAVAALILAACALVLYLLPSTRMAVPGHRLAAVAVGGLLVLAAGGYGLVVEPEYELPRAPSSEVRP